MVYLLPLLLIPLTASYANRIAPCTYIIAFPLQQVGNLLGTICIPLQQVENRVVLLYGVEFQISNNEAFSYQTSYRHEVATQVRDIENIANVYFLIGGEVHNSSAF